MEIKENKIQIQRTAAYYSAGDKLGARYWYCCHGYGQLASNMINKFNRKVKEGDYVICAEAPNRFYWKGVSGVPVSTWMTKRFRLEEIADNNKYLSNLFDSEMLDNKDKVLFGFSQGGTTIWRWIHECRPDFDVFINYAGWIPEDIDLTILKEYLVGKRLVFVYGTEDEYLTVDRIHALEEVISLSGLTIEIIKVKGTHRIDRDVIDQIMI